MSRAVLRSGPIVIDPFHFEVRISGRRVGLEPQVMKVLVHLLERPGEVITKEELLRKVWEGRYVGDEVVAVAAYQIRKALGDRASKPRYLETVHRRGYRWIGPVAQDDSRPPGGLRLTERLAPRRIAIAAFGLLAASVTLFLLPGPSPPKPPREALALYEQGRYFLDRRTSESLNRAAESFEAAIALAPELAPAYAGLADTLSVRADMGLAHPADVVDRAQELAEHALALDAGSAEAWTSSGLVHFLLRFDLQRGEAEMRRAVELDPDFAFGRQAYAWLLSADGRLRDAVSEMRRATLLAPVGISPRLDLAFILGLAGEDDEAVRVAEEALALDDRQLAAYATLGWAHAHAGRARESFAAFRVLMERSGERDAEVERLAKRVEREGLPSLYRHWLEVRGNDLGFLARARMHALLGESEEALRCLENAYRERDTGVLWVKADPSFAGLRRDPRFQRLVKRLSL